MSVCCSRISIIRRLMLCGFPIVAAVSAHAQNANAFMRWPKASHGLIFGLAAFFTIVIGLLIFYQWNVRRKAVKGLRESSRKVFDEECRRCQLTEEEKEVLTDLAAYLPENQEQHMLFESIGLFERCMDAYVNRRLGEIKTSERMEDEDELLRFLRKKLEYDILSHEQPIFSTRNITVGQTMSVFASGQRAALAQNTKAVHVGEFYFTVRVADEFREKLYFAVGSELTIAFVRQGDAVYSVNAKVMSINNTGGINFYHTLKFMRSQKRQYMRLELNTSLTFRILSKADSEEVLSSQTYTGRVADISGGGLSFFMDEEPISAGDGISVGLALPGEPMNGIRAKVVRVTPVEKRASIHYRYHIQYTEIEPWQREHIVKFVFEKHRQMLQMR